MSEILGIIGAGHLGQQIAHYAIDDKHFENIVFFDDFTEHSTVTNISIIGKVEDVLDSFYNKKITHLIIGVGYKHIDARAALYEQFKDEIPFATIIHSSCWIDPTAIIGKGVVIYPRTIIDAKVVIENNVLLNVGCTIAHDTKIESHCFLSPRVALAGFVSIKEKAILGINCTIIDNVTIASKIQIGAGGVVIKDVVQQGIYVGNPIRLIREL